MIAHAMYLELIEEKHLVIDLTKNLFFSFSFPKGDNWPKNNHSLYAKSPLPSRLSSKTSGKALHSERSSGGPGTKSSAKREDSPWVRREKLEPQTEGRMTLRSRAVHGYSASEPARNAKEPPLPRFQKSRRSITSGQRLEKEDRTPSPVVQQQQRANDAKISKEYPRSTHSTRVNPEKASRRRSIDVNDRREPASTKPTRKRRSCIPVFEPTTESPSSPAYQPVRSDETSTNKRRRSLQDRVKDSVFLSKLVSSERKTSGMAALRESPSQIKRSQTDRRRSSQTPSRAGLRSKHPRQRSEPHPTTRKYTGRDSPDLRKKEQVLSG